MIRITDNMTRSERMAARKKNLDSAIRKMKLEEAKRQRTRLSAKEEEEAKIIIKAILSGQAI